MKVLIVNNTVLPAAKYGGTERVIWDLGKALSLLGHKVYYLVGKGSHCPFAEKVLEYNPSVPVGTQIPDEVDVVHFNFEPDSEIKKPYIVTLHGNINHEHTFDKNTVFISANQAKRYNGYTFVYNGLDWSNYEPVQLNSEKKYCHFLGAAAWKVKNVKAAISISKKAEEKLVVLGGHRLNFRMGFRFTPDLHVSFKGMVNDAQKQACIQQSKGLIFPVLWHEPFGLAIIESMYLGAPVFGTPYGSLKELITPETGIVSANEHILVEAVQDAGRFKSSICHQYAEAYFNATVMAKNYLTLYGEVLNGKSIHNTPPYISSENIQREKYLEFKP